MKHCWMFFALICACSSNADNPPILEVDMKTSDMGIHTPDATQSDDVTVADQGPEPYDGDPCEGGAIWSDAGDAPIPSRDHHATFITTRGAPKLHVVGGTDYGQIFSDHWVAEIQNDGTIGEWSQGESLPVQRAGQSVVSTGDDVWLITGRDGAGFVDTTFRAVFDDQGTIASWNEEAPVPSARFHSAGVHDGTTVWVTGGLIAGGVAQDSVFRATMTDGEITGWETFTLPAARSHHGAAVIGDHIYLALGFTGNPFMNATTPHQDLVRFPISATPGALTLETVANFAGDMSTMSLTATDQCLRTFGGLTYKSDTNAYVYEALSWKILVGDQSFIQQAPMNAGRSHMHQVPYYNGAFYAFGGSVAYQTVTSNVEIGRLQN